MSHETQPNDIVKKRVVFDIPGTDAVTIRRDVEYLTTDAGALTMDIYYPPESNNESRTPAVIIVAGYPDTGCEAIFGCKFKDMGSSISWGNLIACSGLVAIAYTNREPASDLQALLQYVQQNAASLGVDENSIGVWASSGNVPLALSLLMQEELKYIKCAVLCYGVMLDLDGASDAAEMSRQFGFVNPCAGKSIDDLAPNIPLFIVRAGQDQFPRLNETINRFLTGALACNLPVTFVNHPEAPHAFDLFHDSETSREIIKQILAFMRFHVLK